MLAINHTTSATATVIGVSLLLNKPFWLPLILFVIVGSLLPDIDHSNSQISKKIPIIAKLLKHRGVTHSLLAVVILYFLIILVDSNLRFFDQILPIILVYFAFVGAWFGFAIFQNSLMQIQKFSSNFFSKKQIGLASLIVFLVLLLWLGGIYYFSFEIQNLITGLWFIFYGYIVHLFGDFLTKEGIPLFWPIKQKFGLKLFRTNSITESILGLVLWILNIWLLYRCWQIDGYIWF